MTMQNPRRITPFMRSVFQNLTASVTGLATFGALVGTGWFAGQASVEYDTEQAAKAEEAAAQAKAYAQQQAAWRAANPVVKVVHKRRPHQTVIKQVVAGSGVSVTPGRGGNISSGGSSTGSVSSGGGSASGGTSGGGTTSGGSGGSTTPATPPPPPPPPPPAPSSGS